MPNEQSALQGWIKSQRDAGRTLEEIGNLLGVTHQAVLYWLRGERKPDGTSAIKISDVTGIGLRELLQ